MAMSYNDPLVGLLKAQHLKSDFKISYYMNILFYGYKIILKMEVQ